MTQHKATSGRIAAGIAASLALLATPTSAGDRGEATGPYEDLTYLELAQLMSEPVYAASTQEQGSPPPAPASASAAEDLTELDITQLMKEPVYAVSRYEQESSRAPAWVSVVTAREIELYGFRTLADALQSVPGFYTSYDRTYGYLGVRGFSRPGDYNTRVLLLVNGHRVNDAIFDSWGQLNDSIVDLDTVDRIEVVRGPGSSVYGSSAFFGTINVITRPGAALQDAEVSTEVGSYGTYKGRFAVGRKLGEGSDFTLSGSVLESEGQDFYFPEFDSPDTNNGRTEDELDREKAANLFFRATAPELSVEGAYGWREKHSPTAPWGTVFDDPELRDIDARGYLGLGYDHSFSEDWDASAKVTYQHYEYDGYFPYDVTEPGQESALILNRDKDVGEWWGTQIQLLSRALDRHTIIAGVEYRDNFRQDLLNFDEGDPVPVMNEDRYSQVGGPYAQDELTVCEYLSLVGGVRYDYTYPGRFSDTSPRLAAILTPARETTLKLLYGEAFRAPNVNELYYNDGESLKANPDLTPENIRTYEAVLTQDLDNHLQLTLSGYHYDIDDLINQALDPADGLIQYQNLDAATADGADAALIAKFPGLFDASASYGFVDARDTGTDERLTNSPRNLGRFNLSAPLGWRELFGGFQALYVGNRRTLEGTTADAFVVVNVNLLMKNVVTGLDLSAGVYNIFDERYGDPGGEEHLQTVLIQDERTFRVKATYRF